MITHEEYEQKIQTLAEDFINNERNTPKYLEELLNSNALAAKEIFEFRKFFIDQHDFDRVEGYLEIGFYSNRSKEDRVTFFCLEFELESAIRKKRLVKLCKRYDDKQVLFDEEPRLIDYIRVKGSKKGKPENELLDYKAFKQLNISEIVKFDNSFAKLCPYLNPRIPEWAFQNFPTSPLFVRVDPDIISNKRLPQLLTEELQTNPYNIEWTALRFNNNVLRAWECTLANIALSQETAREYWDSNILKVKSLQVSTSNRSPYRSFMLEELIDKNGDEDILIGKCIHLDSKNFDEASLETQTLDHLDLAINVYEGDGRITRLEESLKNGKIIDADYRTHILRIDNIPFKILPVFCLLFFTSKTLTEKYLKLVTEK